MPRLPGCESVYEVANQWRDRCLAANGSLLWPDLAEPTWTTDNLQQFLDAFIGNPDLGSKSFLEKWQEQLSPHSPSIHRLAADAIAVYGLFPRMKPATKIDLVRSVVEWSPQLPANLEAVEHAFEHGIGSTGTWYMTGRPWQVGFYAQFAKSLKEHNRDPFSFEAVKTTANEALQESPRNVTATCNMLVHLLFPDETESISNEEMRRDIISALGSPSKSTGDLDDQLSAIRQELAPTYGPGHFNLYDPQIRALWDKVESSLQGSEAEPAGSEVNSEGPSKVARSMSLLSSATFMPSAQLSEIEVLLHDKKQIILEGPPGSGKTYVAKLFARYLAEIPLDQAIDEHVEIVQFHQSYGYEDFVAGIRPTTNESGQLTYQNQPGIFLEMCRRAAEYPDENFVLIIDEINRGNLSRIFGELLYGLEYRDQPVRMQYGQLEGDDTEGHLTIPDNLYLIGTMNSTDRSLAMIDYALRRRFYFWRLLPVENRQAPVLERWLASQPELGTYDRAWLLAAFIEMNSEVTNTLGEDYQIGHSYFMVPGGNAGDRTALRRVWRHALEPLLREYFHHRPNAGDTISGLEHRFFQDPELGEDSFEEISEEA